MLKKLLILIFILFSTCKSLNLLNYKGFKEIVNENNPNKIKQLNEILKETAQLPNVIQNIISSYLETSPYGFYKKIKMNEFLNIGPSSDDQIKKCNINFDPSGNLHVRLESEFGKIRTFLLSIENETDVDRPFIYLNRNKYLLPDGQTAVMVSVPYRIYIKDKTGKTVKILKDPIKGTDYDIVQATEFIDKIKKNISKKFEEDADRNREWERCRNEFLKPILYYLPQTLISHDLYHIFFWDLNSGKCVDSLKIPGGFGDFSVSNDGEYIAVTDYDTIDIYKRHNEQPNIDVSY